MKIKFRIYGIENTYPIEYFTTWITELCKEITAGGRDWNCFMKEVGFEVIETIAD